MKEKTYISTVIYLENNRSVLNFIKKIDGYLFNHFENHEIILVNNCKGEKISKEIAKDNHLFSTNLIILNLPWKHKLESAMLAGTEMAVGDYIFEIDTISIDYSIEILMDLYNKAISGYDLVGAMPKTTQKFSSKIFYNFLNKVSYLNFNIQTENVRVISRRLLNRVLSYKEKTRYRKVLYRYSGFPYFNIYYTPLSKNKKYRQETFSEKVSLAIDVLFIYSNIGLKLSAILSILFFLISLAIGLYAIIIFLILKTVVSGWTSTALFLSLGFSGLFLVSGILGKYLAILLHEIQDRPDYVIESIEKINKNVDSEINK